MKDQLLGFNDFVRSNKLFEAVDRKKEEGDFALLYSNKAEKKGQDAFVAEASMMDYRELNSLMDATLSKGSSLTSGMEQAWKKRAELGLDEGPLTKKGAWFVGKGAWRVNSAKAVKIGLLPDGMKYFDPKQEEILAEHFGEDYGASDTSVGPDGELDGLETPEVQEEPEAISAGPIDQRELVTSENMKYVLLLEQDESFTLGPPSSAKRAIIVDPTLMIRKLVQNFSLHTRDNVMIWGAPGIGKTDIVRQAASEISKKTGKDIPVMVITLATKAKYDIQGLPLLFVDKSGEDKEALKQMVLPKEYKGQVGMDFAYPAWLPPPGDETEGILFFDEINRADPEVLGACLTLMLDRVSGSYRIPNGWRIWAAGNRDMDGPVTKFEGAMASRFLGGHFHLVPTVESWAEWARSDRAFFKGIDGKGFGGGNEWYIPIEFISFLKLKDVRGASDQGSKTGADGKKELVGADSTSNLGRTFRTKFDYFYNWDSAAANENSGGKMEGFPTPRTWTRAFSNVFQQIKSNEKLMQMASENIDPRSRTISLLGVGLGNDTEFAEDVLDTFGAIVGSEAADTFIQFSKQMGRYNDGGTSLIEKIENVFNGTTDESKLPLLSINAARYAAGASVDASASDKVTADESYSIMTMVDGRFDDMISGGKNTTPQVLSWMKYVMDLLNSKLVSKGEIVAHVAGIFNKHAMVFHPILKTPDSIPELKDPKTMAMLKSWVDAFKGTLKQMNNL